MTTSAEPGPTDGFPIDRPDELLVIRGGVVAYGESIALEGVDLQVRRGEALALIGPNGAGKSTLLRAILGLAPLAAGQVSVMGRPPAQARGQVAYVPQADTLDREFPVSVQQVVLMGRYRAIGWGRRPSRADRAAALGALDEVGLADRRNDRFGTLSGGQRQRVLLARALAQGARLLLLDEPFNGLDAATSEILISVIGRLREGGAGIVMATHDLTVAHLTCGDACLLNRRQIAWGPIASTLTQDHMSATYGSGAAALVAGATLAGAPVQHGEPHGDHQHSSDDPHDEHDPHR